MNIHEPGVELFGSAATLTLTTLRPDDDGLSLIELAEATGLTTDIARSTVRSLSDAGFVTQRRVGQAPVYYANRRHPGWHGIEQILDARKTILERVTEVSEELVHADVTVALLGPESSVSPDGKQRVHFVILPAGTDVSRSVALREAIFALVRALTGTIASVDVLSGADLRAMAEDPEAAPALRQAITTHGPELSAILDVMNASLPHANRTENQPGQDADDRT